MATYAEKLQDPRWQRKRLEVLERAGWKCESCGKADAVLHVHHGRYAKGREPWEYSANQLYSLCKPCHVSAEVEKQFAYGALAGVSPQYMESVAWLIDYLSVATNDRNRHERDCMMSEQLAKLGMVPEDSLVLFRRKAHELVDSCFNAAVARSTEVVSA